MPIEALSKFVFSENSDVASYSLWAINNLTPELQNLIEWREIIPYIRAEVKNATRLQRFISVGIWTLSKYMKYIVECEQEAMEIMIELRRFLTIETETVKLDALRTMSYFVEKFNALEFLKEHSFMNSL